MVRLVRVISNDGNTRTTVYEGSDGNTYTLQGDLGVRANNPGNISPSAGGRSFWVSNFGAIGFVPSSPGEPYVAIFPDAASGAAAQRYLWSTPTYQNLTISQAARRWASNAYPDALAAAAGVPASTLVRDLTPAQMDAMYAAQRAAEGAPRLTVLDAQGNRLDPAIITGGHPVPPGLIGAETSDRLAAIQDREAGRLGYGELPPQPLSRPNSFNETGAPPVPLTRPNSFNETGAPPVPLPRPGSSAPRITDSGSLLAALNGLTSDTAMSVTPRLPDGLDLGGSGAATFPPVPNSGRTNYAPASVPMDQSTVQARATILDEGAGSLLNPSSPSPSALNPGQDLEILRQLLSPVVAGRPDAPIGTLPAARTGTMITGRPDAPIGSLPAARTGTTITGRPDAPIGSLPASGLSAPGAGLTPAQRAAMSSVRGTVAEPAPSIVRTTGGIAGTADLPSTYRPPASVMPGTSSSSTTVARPGNTLSPPGAGLTQAQRTAMATVPLSAGVRLLAAPIPASTAPRTTTTTITNPAFTQWQQRYGDGSQVQTAATGGMVTANQLAAIQNVNGAVQAPIVHVTPPPPRTITVTRTVAAPAQPAAGNPPTPRPSPIVSIGGYVYDSSQ